VVELKEEEEKRMERRASSWLFGETRWLVWLGSTDNVFVPQPAKTLPALSGNDTTRGPKQEIYCTACPTLEEPHYLSDRQESILFERLS